MCGIQINQLRVKFLNKHPPPHKQKLPGSFPPHSHHHGDTVRWHFNSCETLVIQLTCFSHYSSSSQDSAFSLWANNSDQRVWKKNAESSLQHVPGARTQGPWTVRGPRIWSHLRWALEHSITSSLDHGEVNCVSRMSLEVIRVLSKIKLFHA